MSPDAGSGLRRRFEAERPFPLDPFQREALEHLDAGRPVLVAAPTGSGKTVVAEYAIARAVEGGGRAFYTTPLKALSNQKYGDLARVYGERRVGLLTGDTSINPAAAVVVMTTEVLRNMIYSGSDRLADLRCVILDEVHYLEDPYRGAVWEEIILTAPSQVALVCLSATVSNAEELAGWIGRVRGATGTVIEERRPIELTHLYVVAERRSEELLLLPTFVDGRPNPEAVALDEQSRRDLVRGAARGRHRAHAGGRLRRPRRTEVVERLAEGSLLPAIYFVFSRAGCDDAVRNCRDAGVRLTTPEERRKVREILERRIGKLSTEDLAVLGYPALAQAMESGIAPHHAGMVPPLREAVEECFQQALVKVVFATETLALGINMPARSVVIEQLSKFSGAGHADLTPGEYTQLTGRAGRRGIDESGWAAVLWSPFHSFADVARLAGSRSRALRSSFRPTYNMAVNLVRRYAKDEAYRLVRSSFAQFLSEAPLTGQLDAVVSLLQSRGYLRGWSVTADGERLAGLYHERDLLIAEALRHGVLDHLDAASLAALVSVLAYEPRRESPLPELPTAKLARRCLELAELAADLRSDERARGLPQTRELDAGFALLAYEWAKGRDLRQLLTPADRGRRGRNAEPVMTGGDFVRNMKQLMDLLRQIGIVCEEAQAGRVARSAADRLLRGIVAASNPTGLGVDDDLSEDELEELADAPPA